MALTRTTDDSRIEPVELGTPTGAPSSRAGLRGIGLLVPAGATLVWELAARLGLISTRLLPAPSEVAATIFDLAQSGALAGHVTATLWRVMWGFLAGAAVATVLGVATGMSTRLRRMLDPTLQALRSIPSIAWTPLFILWFGIFEASKITLIAVGVFFPIYLALSDAIAGVDRKLVEVGRIYGFDTATMVRRILLPASMPTYFIGLRGGLGLGWMFVVAAEFLGASEGLGYLLVDGQMTGRSEVIVAAIVVFAVLGKTTDWLLARTGGKLVAWQDGFRTGTAR
jgi:sulfonate transport system permease protein